MELELLWFNLQEQTLLEENNQLKKKLYVNSQTSYIEFSNSMMHFHFEKISQISKIIIRLNNPFPQLIAHFKSKHHTLGKKS